MNTTSVLFAKLAGLYKTVSAKVSNLSSRYFDPGEVIEYFDTYRRLAAELRTALPDLFDDLPNRPIPESSGTTDFHGRGYIERDHLERLLRDLDYIFEVRSN